MRHGHLGANYVAERYIAASGLGQPGYAPQKYKVVPGLGYAAERYIPVPGLGQPGYAAERYIPTQMGSAPYAMERYIPTSLGQPGYAAERYVPVPGLGQTKGTSAGSAAFVAATSSGGKGGGTATSSGGKGGGTASGQDNTARDWRTAGEVGGALIGGIIRATGPQTPAPTDPSMLPADQAALAPAQDGMDWYWPVIIGGGLILVGGVGYLALKGDKKQSAPTANKRRKRVSRNGYGRSHSADPRWMQARFAGVDDEGRSFKKGEEILYWPSTKTVMTGQRAKDAWLRFLSEKGDEEGMPFAMNGKRRSRSKRTSRR